MAAVEKEPAPRRALPRWLQIGVALVGIASFFGFVALLFRAVHIVREGRGLETFHTDWLGTFNWIGFLVLCSAIAITLVVVVFLRLREYLEWRSLEKKYGSNRTQPKWPDEINL